VVLLFVALPFLWMAYAAFMPKEAVYSGELFSKVGFSLENVRGLAKEGFWGRLFSPWPSPPRWCFSSFSPPFSPPTP
jgi:ABC-type glycerol-3-phosphate transport system permease component